MAPVRAVIFDLGETLVTFRGDPLETHRQGSQRVYGLLWQRLALPIGLEEFTRRLLEIRRHLFEKTFRELRQYTATDALQYLLAELGLEASDALLQEAVRRYFEPELEAYQAVPDAPAVLKALRDQGLQLALLSNASDHSFILNLVEARGFAPYLDLVETSARLGVPKPHPRAFQAVLERLGVAPEEAVMVGDSLAMDIAGARQVGLRAVWIPRDRQAPFPFNREILTTRAQPDHQISRLRDLLSWPPLAPSRS